MYTVAHSRPRTSGHHTSTCPDSLQACTAATEKAAIAFTLRCEPVITHAKGRKQPDRQGRHVEHTCRFTCYSNCTCHYTHNIKSRIPSPGHNCHSCHRCSVSRGQLHAGNNCGGLAVYVRCINTESMQQSIAMAAWAGVTFSSSAPCLRVYGSVDTSGLQHTC